METTPLHIPGLQVWDRQNGGATSPVWGTRVRVHLTHAGSPHIPYASIDLDIALDYPDQTTRDYVMRLLEEGKPKGDTYTLTWQPGDRLADLVRDSDNLNISDLRLVPV